MGTPVPKREVGRGRNTAEQVLAPFWVWIGVGEAPGAATVAGGALVLLAILTQALDARDRPHP